MIVISTPTGQIGAAVAASLRSSGEPLRLIVRDPSRLPQSLREDAEIVPGSHSDPAVLRAALPGADALFVLVPPDFSASDVMQHYLGFARPVAEAVREFGVPQVVAVSSLGRGFHEPAGMLSAAWAMDEAIEASGAAYRSLQPPFFMENLLHQAELIGNQGLFVLAADPDVPYPAVAVRDIADVAARLLRDRSWTGQQGVPVREPADHTPRELAQIMTEVLGRPVRYEQASMADYRAQYAAHGASPAVVHAMVEMAEAQLAGVYPPAHGAGSGSSFEQWCATVLAPALGLSPELRPRR